MLAKLLVGKWSHSFMMKIKFWEKLNSRVQVSHSCTIRNRELLRIPGQGDSQGKQWKLKGHEVREGASENTKRAIWSTCSPLYNPFQFHIRAFLFQLFTHCHEGFGEQGSNRQINNAVTSRETKISVVNRKPQIIGGNSKRVRDPFQLRKSISLTSKAKGRFYETR